MTATHASGGASTLLDIVDLDVNYGAIEALHRVCLRVSAGETVAVLGANGAGKTTMLRTICGLHPPAAGQIVFDGRRIDGLRAHQVSALGVGTVPEGRRVFGRMSVRENLLMGAYRSRVDASSRMDRVFTLFPVLAERRGQDAGTLSGGEQQMLAMGRALMGDPRLLLLDEPSMGLAPLVVEQIFRIIGQVRSAGVTVLLVEQNAVQALRIADRGYVLESGAVAATGSARELLSDDRVRAAYLG